MRLHMLVQHKLSPKVFAANVAPKWFLVSRMAQLVGNEFVFKQKTLPTNDALKFKFTYSE